MQRTRRRRWYVLKMKLAGTDHKTLDQYINDLKRTLEQHKIKVYGPIYLPTKTLVLGVRRTPCGQGSETYDHYELRIHRRLIILRLRSPKDLMFVSSVKIPRGIVCVVGAAG